MIVSSVSSERWSYGCYSCVLESWGLVLYDLFLGLLSGGMLCQVVFSETGNENEQKKILIARLGGIISLT